MPQRNENRFLYMLKGIACMAVVLLHSALPEAIAGPVRALSRFAVPVFFLISGYYLPDDRPALSRRLKKTAKLTAVVWAVSMSVSACLLWAGGGDVSAWLRTCFGPGEWLRLLTLNSALCIAAPPSYSDFMWYLFALMYVCLLSIPLAGLSRQTRRALCAVLLTGFFLMQYIPGFSAVFPGLKSGDPRIYRNFLFYGLPFTLLGHEIAQTEPRIRPRLPALTALVGGALAVGEVVLRSDCELPLGAALLAVSLVLLAKLHPETGFNPLVRIGRNLSMHVYCWHVSVLNAVNALLIPCLPEGLRLIQPLAVLALSLLLAQVLHIIKTTR